MSKMKLLSLVALFAILLAACGGKKQQPDLLAEARAAVEGAANSEPCAESEYRAAQNLLEQAEKALADGDRDRAEQLAEAAKIQAARAQQIADANKEECERLRNMRDQVAPPPPATPEPGDENYTLERIFFPFNESSITDEARSILERHARYLVRNTGVRIQVQGHCDSAGSTEYNLALGERRARTVREYLQRLGVDPSRISVVSYGEEVPLGSDEDKNRRAEFVVK